MLNNIYILTKVCDIRNSDSLKWKVGSKSLELPWMELAV